jgi:hypothetical protein
LRIPARCPLGITPVRIEQQEQFTRKELEAFEAAERESHQLRFSDDTDLAKHGVHSQTIARIGEVGYCGGLSFRMRRRPDNEV